MFLNTNPAAMTSAAGGLMGTGTAVTARNAGAAEPTMGVLPPGMEETSALMAASFATHGAVYQAAAAVATAMHAQMVAMLATNSVSYEVADVAGAVQAL